MEDMKQKIRSELESHARGNAQRETKDLVIKKIVEMNPIEVPESLVEEQIKHMVAQAVKNKSQDKQAQTEPSTEGEVNITDSQKIEHKELTMIYT